MDPRNPNHLNSPEVKARIEENQRRFAEAHAAVPEPTEPDKDSLIVALVAEGFNRDNVDQSVEEWCEPMPEIEVRSLLEDWRTLCWLNENYPEDP